MRRAGLFLPYYGQRYSFLLFQIFKTFAHECSVSILNVSTSLTSALSLNWLGGLFGSVDCLEWKRTFGQKKEQLEQGHHGGTGETITTKGSGVVGETT